MAQIGPSGQPGGRASPADWLQIPAGGCVTTLAGQSRPHKGGLAGLPRSPIHFEARLGTFAGRNRCSAGGIPGCPKGPVTARQEVRAASHTWVTPPLRTLLPAAAGAVVGRLGLEHIFQKKSGQLLGGSAVWAEPRAVRLFWSGWAAGRGAKRTDRFRSGVLMGLFHIQKGGRIHGTTYRTDRGCCGRRVIGRQPAGLGGQVHGRFAEPLRR